MSPVLAAAGVNVEGTRQPQLYAATIITYCLAVLALICRLVSRRLMRSGYGLDDWFAVTALVKDLDPVSYPVEMY